MHSLQSFEERERENESSNNSSEFGSPNYRGWNGQNSMYGNDSIDLNKFFEKMTFKDLYNDFAESNNQDNYFPTKSNMQTRTPLREFTNSSLNKVELPLTNITNITRDCKQTNQKENKKAILLRQEIERYLDRPLENSLILKVTSEISYFSPLQSLESYSIATENNNIFKLFEVNNSKSSFSLFSSSCELMEHN